ncbi:MAG TPA: ubiquinol-cytochrome C chaperone family protein [Alphaproteobacteria bacterium]|nr:ubiquinol-cytochrome C chaperone family protein [Alphaproteobacteria bacterium]HNS45201.1 ubiquinol-cytochrome C chaperone family protein [Alphaproteobacteria bacterium]
MFGFLQSKRRTTLETARNLYDLIMDASRQKWFYKDGMVPDTVEGRFEILTLHVGLVVNRLCKPDMGKEGRVLAQTLFDVMFRNLDWSLREMGVGDLAVPRRVKKMMESFKGRTFAYDEALKSGSGEIKHALIRNMYGKVAEPHAAQLDVMADYVQGCADKLDKQGLSDFWMGRVYFSPVPTSTSQERNDYKQAA